MGSPLHRTKGARALNLLRFHKLSDPDVIGEYVEIFMTQKEIDDTLASEDKFIQWHSEGTLIRLRILPDEQACLDACNKSREEQFKALQEQGESVNMKPAQEKAPAIYLPGKHFRTRRPSD